MRSARKETKHFTVEAGLNVIIPIVVEKDCVLLMEFSSSDFLYFSLQYHDDNSMLFPPKWTKTEARTVLCSQSGTLDLNFDNYKAWLKSSLISLSFTLCFPLHANLESPHCFLLTEENKDLVLDCSRLTAQDIIASGRRLLGFPSQDVCQRLTGRKLESAADLSVMSTHPFLLPTCTSSRPLCRTIQLGTFNFEHLSKDTCKQLFECFLQAEGCTECDTARSYHSEHLVAQYFPHTNPRLQVHTKFNPWPNSGKGLDSENLRAQLILSKQALSPHRIQILYLHAPDSKTSLEITLAAVHEMHKQGEFVELGLSNFAAWQVVLCVHLCRQHGWIAPTVYQGMYNFLTREVEAELFPALRVHHMRFVAYNPLAGGLLTGRYSTVSAIPTSGRFKSKTAVGDRYLERYWHGNYFGALELVDKTCRECNISLTDAAFRWLVCHSYLREEDAIVLGASSVEHLRENMALVKGASPLPQILLNAMDHAWEMCAPSCPKYYRQ